jgi:hypothetical protein
MSRLLARAFSSASNAAGNRNEIVSVDALRLGNTATRALLQSTYGLVFSHHRPVEKHLFGFRLTHLVTRPVLRRVRLVPLESFIKDTLARDFSGRGSALQN